MERNRQLTDQARPPALQLAALSKREKVVAAKFAAGMTHREVGALYDQITRLRAEGVAIMFCSHRLDEVSHLADRITVLRDGAVVRRAVRGELTEAAHLVERAVAQCR